MNEELEAAKRLAEHPATIVGLFSSAFFWLANRVWRSARREFEEMKDTNAKEHEAIWKEMDRRLARREAFEADIEERFRDYERHQMEREDRREASDRTRHEELVSIIGDLRTEVALLKGAMNGKNGA